jgi:hypothetical protein
MITRREAMLVAKYIRNSAMSIAVRRELTRNIMELFETSTPGFRKDIFWALAMAQIEKDALNNCREIELEEKINALRHPR